MGNAKFNLNAFVLVVILFSSIIFFFTVNLTDLASHSAVNEYHPIEGTDAAVCYRSLEPSGIYVGDRSTGVLKLEGEFGFDWGLAREGNSIYTNEYSRTSLGLILCQVVRIDLSSFEKTVLLPNSVLRGRCASGELVCVNGAMLSACFPRSNSLCRLFSMSAPALNPVSGEAEVVYLDPADGHELCRLPENAYNVKFEELYLQRSLREVAP